jgi:hypothetical protein
VFSIRSYKVHSKGGQEPKTMQLQRLVQRSPSASGLQKSLWRRSSLSKRWQKARSKSLGRRVSNNCRRTPIAAPVADVAWKFFSLIGLSGFRKIATFALRDAASLINSSRLAQISGLNSVVPVTLPPGFARLAIIPVATASPLIAITMGIVAVAIMAARVPGVPHVTINSTWSRTSSAATSASRSRKPMR